MYTELKESSNTRDSISLRDLNPHMGVVAKETLRRLFLDHRHFWKFSKDL